MAAKKTAPEATEQEAQAQGASPDAQPQEAEAVDPIYAHAREVIREGGAIAYKF